MHSHRFCVAPMLDWTDRHCRVFHRMLSRRARLYTEMVTTAAILHGDRSRLLDFDPAEHPLALQLGGSDPGELATCAALGAQWGYDEINLNVGCPSDRVQKGRFGACLMKEPETVAAGVKAMRDRVSLPVTVKSRIGVDEIDSYEALLHFVGLLWESGCETLILHARKAWLKGLSPRQNREVPPLRYDLAVRLKKDLPGLAVVLNGGIETLEACQEHLNTFEGVMLGRSVYHQPALLAEVDRQLFGDTNPAPSREAIIEAMLPYIEQQLSLGQRLHAITRHMLGLYHGEPGGRVWRRQLGEAASRSGADQEVLRSLLAGRRSGAAAMGRAATAL